MAAAACFEYTAAALDVTLPLDEVASSSFDKAIQARWVEHRTLGHFRFSLDWPESRVTTGPYKFVVQYNPLRGTTRRAPQAMEAVVQPFNPAVFNFTKVDDDKELVFEFVNGDDRTQSGNRPGRFARDVVFINVSPVEFGHSLLVPSVEACLPQVLTRYSLALAMRAVLLSHSPDFKAAFNSLCAHASVNHLHWHLYYLRGHRLLLETVAVHPIGAAGCCFELLAPDYPAQGFVFQLLQAADVEHVSQLVFRLVTHLQNSNIAHNVFITRGSRLDAVPSSTQGIHIYNAVRIFVWARTNLTGAKDPLAFPVAVLELSGQFMVFSREDLEARTEADIIAMHQATCDATFTAVRDDVRKLFS